MATNTVLLITRIIPGGGAVAVLWRCCGGAVAVLWPCAVTACCDEAAPFCPEECCGCCGYCGCADGGAWWAWACDGGGCCGGWPCPGGGSAY